MYFLSSSDMQKHNSMKKKQIKQKLIATLVISTIIVRSQDTLTYADMFIDLNNDENKTEDKKTKKRRRINRINCRICNCWIFFLNPLKRNDSFELKLFSFITLKELFQIWSDLDSSLCSKAHIVFWNSIGHFFK